MPTSSGRRKNTPTPTSTSRPTRTPDIFRTRTRTLLGRSALDANTLAKTRRTYPLEIVMLKSGTRGCKHRPQNRLFKKPRLESDPRLGTLRLDRRRNVPTARIAIPCPRIILNAQVIYLQFLVFISLSCALAAVLQGSGRGALKLTILIFLSVPFASSFVLTGVHQGDAAPDLHPATWFTIEYGAINCLRRLPVVWRAVVPYKWALAGVAVITLDGIYSSRIHLGQIPIPFLLNQILVPFTLFIWIQAEIARRPESRAVLARFTAGFASLLALLALLGAAAGISSLYGIPTAFSRQAVTLDHPLTLALLLAVSIPLVVSFPSGRTQLVLVIVLLAGQALTQSRTGIILSLIGVAFVLVRSRTSLTGRSVALLAAPAAIVLAASSSLAAGLIVRFEDDLGSTALRDYAADWFASHWTQFVASTGGGIGSSYTLAETVGLNSSFESAFYMYAIDFGLVTTLIYFGTFLLQTLPRRNLSFGVGAAAGTTLAFIFIQGYSSIATESAAGAILWIVGGIAAVRPIDLYLRQHPRQNESSWDEYDAKPHSAHDTFRGTGI